MQELLAKCFPRKKLAIFARTSNVSETRKFAYVKFRSTGKFYSAAKVGKSVSFSLIRERSSSFVRDAHFFWWSGVGCVFLFLLSSVFFFFSFLVGRSWMPVLVPCEKRFFGGMELDACSCSC